MGFYIAYGEWDWRPRFNQRLRGSYPMAGSENGPGEKRLGCRLRLTRAVAALSAGGDRVVERWSRSSVRHPQGTGRECDAFLSTTRSRCRNQTAAFGQDGDGRTSITTAPVRPRRHDQVRVTRARPRHDVGEGWCIASRALVLAWQIATASR